MAFALLGSAGLVNSCAERFSSEPEPARTEPTSVTVAEFFTPAPTGEADDYFIMSDDEDDVEYSYFLDEQDYIYARDYDVSKGKHDRYYFIYEKVKNGHGYGDHNHIHIHRTKVKHHYHGVYVGVRVIDWTDSLHLTAAQMHSIDTAMMDFRACSKSTLDSFKVQLKPYRDSFRLRKLEILRLLDADSVTRDSARTMLDSAIVKYEAETNLMRAGLVADLAECRVELDAAMKVTLTPVQYAIWTRHRGW